MLTDRQLRGIPVVTKGGQRVGRLAGFAVEPGTHRIEQYLVSKNRFLSALLPGELLIHASQVVSLDAEKMVVEDGSVAEKISEALKVPARQQAHQTGAASRAE